MISIVVEVVARRSRRAGGSRGGFAARSGVGRDAARLPAAAEPPSRHRTLVNSISEGCNSPVARGAGPAGECSR